MLIRIISQYLEAHKRLVIPQLGTFIVKEPGVSVVFSELLKRDDGVLRQLLCATGIGELEAAGEIDRFVFEVRHAVERGEKFPLEGFGTLQPGPNGTIVFAYEPPPAEAAPEEGISGGQDAAVSAEASGLHPTGEPVAQPGSDPRISPSAKMNPDPSIRGLRYGKPPKNTNAYSYVDRPPRRRADRFVWIALIAAAIAVAAIAFGYFREAHDKEVEMEYIDQPVEQTVIEPAQSE